VQVGVIDDECGVDDRLVLAPNRGAIAPRDRDTRGRAGGAFVHRRSDCPGLYGGW
jgi:hypothetical protein